MEIVNDIKQIGRSKWNAFVECHPHGTVFHTYEMLEVYQNTSHNQPIVVAALEHDHVVGLLLAVLMWNGNEVSKLFTARSIIVGGPLALNDDESVLKLLLQGYRKALPRCTIYSEIRPIYCMDFMDAFLKEEGFMRKGHYNLTLDVSGDKQLLWTGMHKERQRNVKHAEKIGLEYKEVKDDKSVGRVVEMIRCTYKRKRVPMADFNLLLQAKKSLKGHISFFAAYYEGKVIAGQIRLCFKDLVYAWFAGSDEKAFSYYPNDFLMWKLIGWAKENGYEYLDFGGGGEPGVPYGVRDYKLKYGCQMFDYGRFQLLHRPLMYKIGEFGANIIIKK